MKIFWDFPFIICAKIQCFLRRKEKTGIIPNLLADITKYKEAECCGKWQDFVIFDIKNDISCKVRQDFASSHFQYKKEKTGVIPNLFGGYYKIQGSRMLRQVTGFCHFNHENIVAVTAEM